MITLSTSGSSIVFEFSGNSTYLNDGTITVPQNSLALIVDESDMVSFKKANSNDLFVSANISEFGMTKDELISWYETNMVGSTGGGVTSGDVQSMIDASVADYFDGVEYDSGTTRINFYHGNTVKAYIDASDFVIDGMIDDVRIETISGVTYLVIDFNTESGKEDIQIPLTDIFNPDNYYTKSETSGATEIATAIDAKGDAIGLDMAASPINRVRFYIKSGGPNGRNLNQVDLNLGKGLTFGAEGFKTLSTSGLVETSAVTTSVTSASTDSQVPSAKAVYDALGSAGGGKAIEAGRGIAVTTGETADTVSFNLPIYLQGSSNLMYTNNNNTLKGDINSYCNSIFGELNTIDKYGTNINNYCAYNNIFGRNNKLFVDSSINRLAYNFICGDYNTISASTNSIANSFVLGFSNKGNKSNQALIGWNNNATNSVEMSFGQYNVSSSGSSTYGDSGNTLFSVGNGTADDARHNAFEIRQNGDIYLSLDGQDVKLQDHLGGGGVTTGEVQTMIDESISGKVDTTTYNTYTAATDAALSGKQETLSAGTGIDITDNVISATGGGGKAIEAGTNISVTTGETADTINCTLPIKKFNGWDISILDDLNNNSSTNANGTTLIGYGNSVYGSNLTKKYQHNTIIGVSNKISATINGDFSGYNFIAGKENKLSGNTNTTGSGIIGFGNISYSYNTFIGGMYNKTYNAYETAFGAYNNSSSATTTFGDSGNTLFSVGNGWTTYKHNVIDIRQNGDIYIVDTSDSSTYYSKPMIKLQDALGGGSITIDPSLDSGSTNAVANSAITTAIDAVSGAIPTVTTAVTSGSTDVLTSGGAYEQLGGLKLIKLTESEYAALATKDPDVLYVVVPDPTNP